MREKNFVGSERRMSERSPNYETYLYNILNRLSEHYKNFSEADFRRLTKEEIYRTALELSRAGDAEIYGDELGSDLGGWIRDQISLKGENELRGG